MRVVDVSAMIGPWPTDKLEFSTPEALVRKMDHYGIDEAYVYSSYAVKVNPIDGNKLLMEQLKGFEDRLKPCWVILPTWDMESQRPLEEELKENNVKLVRMMPPAHSFMPEPWVCGEVYEMLQRRHMPLLFNMTDVTLSQIHAIAQAYPQLPIIMTQVEYGQNRSLYKLLQSHPNVYLEIATYYIYCGIEDIAKKFGAERMIFGSRMPFQEGAAALSMTMLADITEQERVKILSGNIETLLEGVGK